MSNSLLNIYSNSIYSKTTVTDVNSNYGLSSNVLQLVNVAAVENMLMNLITISPGELTFSPTIGSGIQSYLFENATSLTGWNIMDNLFYAVKKFLPFISIDLKNSAVYAGVGYFVLDIAYSIKNLNVQSKLSLTLAPNQ